MVKKQTLKLGSFNFTKYVTWPTISDIVGHVTNCAEDEIVLGEILTRINELSNQVSEALGNNYAHI